jgi:selenide, water dikinase
MTDTREELLRLTEFARCAGCASKMGPGDLSRALAPLVSSVDPRLIVGRETFDDAGVFRLSDDLALVQTVDFFPPIVDDPFTFGRVAATNALSDVYAMGGEPLTALNIVGFPVKSLPLEVLTEILRGGQAAVQDAGAVIVGGHTVEDEELKYGVSVTGRVDPRRILTNAAARPGDRLLLTKPIGTGLVSTAFKKWREKMPAAVEQRMVDVMCTLNRDAARAAVALGVQCATDVTGFGLLGHASHVARASGVTLRIAVSRVPILEGAEEAFGHGARTAGGERNAEYLKPFVDWGVGRTAFQRALLVDPQTSGGLLVAAAPGIAAEYVRRVAGAVEIGEVVAGKAAIDLV